jgi:hypothetical protein
MSTATLTATFALIGQQVTIYCGIPILIAGVIGGFLAIIVMLSLQTFRENKCAFFLIIMQFFNIGQLLAGLLSRILMGGFNIDLTQTSNIICKLRIFVMQTCTLMSLTCLCLATIDQYFATCSRPSWQRWMNLKLAHRLIIIFTFIWLLHGILYLVFVNIISIPSIGIVYCLTGNHIFLEYHNYFFLLVLTGFLPIIFLTCFGCLAYFNVRQLSYRTVPLVRQELDKQLTVMVLLQVFLHIFSLLPYAIGFILSCIPQIMNQPIAAAYVNFLNTLFDILFYVYFAVSRNRFENCHS